MAVRRFSERRIGECWSIRRHHWYWKLLVCAMTICFYRPSAVLGSWIRHVSTRHAKGSFFSPSISVSFGHQHDSTQSRRIHSVSLHMAKWNVGDSVLVRANGEKLVDGSITETRGSGWYTVQLEDSSNTTLKCRSSQLTPTVVAAAVETFTAQSRTRPKIQADVGHAPKLAPPPPTIHDLDASLLAIDEVSNQKDRELLEQVKHHASFETWVAFTDLHCSPASLETCLEVLDTVHKEALERNAGVVFLGDFWHHRGTLRVDCLNAILEHFRSWKVPMIMIPGNHDQITLGGHSHSLTPIENSYRVGDVPGPLIFSYPTKFRNAMFIPHIRDTATMESVLQSSPALESSSLFVHAEVTGALMNDLLVSTGGVPPASFPTKKRIYSGHFHKPHTVKSSNVNIEYLGSPYETSLAEAQQQKMLAVMDAEWKCTEYVPVNIGRRHFKVPSWKEFLQLQLQTEVANIAPTNVTLKPKDRVVVSIPKEEVATIQEQVGSHINMMRKAGVTVEIREVKAEPLDRTSIPHVKTLEEDMTIESTWRAYLAEETKREALSDNNAQLLLEAGLRVLEEIDSSGELRMAPSEATELHLNSVSVEGFGPFQSQVTYPLLDRGLVLLKGRNHDGGSDSNGSGKSSLAMAALWALSGSLDPRRAQDGKVSDVINDYSKVARVSLEGSINGLPFSISRTKMASKGGLVFYLDGKDLTTQSVKETQLVIDQTLGVGSQILSRTMFHGQHALNDLLESTDAKFKEDLSLLVPLELWQKASGLARKKSRDAKTGASELNGMLKLRAEDVDKLRARKAQAEQKLQERKTELAELEGQYESFMASEGDQKSSESELIDLEGLLSTSSSNIMTLDERSRSLQSQRDSDLEPFEINLSKVNDCLGSISEEFRMKERQLFSATVSFDAAKETVKMLEKKWSIDISSGFPQDFVSPEKCPTCLQPVTEESIDGEHSHVNLGELLEDEMSKALAALESSKTSFQICTKALAECSESKLSHEEMKNKHLIGIERVAKDWDQQIEGVNQDLTARRQEFGHLSERLSSIAKNSQVLAKQEALKAEVEASAAAVEFANETYAALSGEIEDGEKRLARLEAEKQEHVTTGLALSDLGERFGQRGVQAFLLENVVGALETLCEVYLYDLSDGAQRLSLSLDSGDRISRVASVIGADGDFRDRPLSTLSGGQWRRCSLALTFAFAELVARRGKLRPSLCVLDEPLTHLDRSGRAKVGEVIRGMLRSPDSAEFRGFGGLGMTTVLIILQDLAAEELDEAFDCIDEVVKAKSESYVIVDELT